MISYFRSPEEIRLVNCGRANMRKKVIFLFSHARLLQNIVNLGLCDISLSRVRGRRHNDVSIVTACRLRSLSSNAPLKGITVILAQNVFLSKRVKMNRCHFYYAIIRNIGANNIRY